MTMPRAQLAEVLDERRLLAVAQAPREAHRATSRVLDETETGSRSRPTRSSASARALVVVLAGDRVLELAHPLAERAAHLGQRFGPKTRSATTRIRIRSPGSDPSRHGWTRVARSVVGGGDRWPGQEAALGAGRRRHRRVERARPRDRAGRRRRAARRSSSRRGTPRPSTRGREIERAGSEALAVRTDVTDLEQVGRVVVRGGRALRPHRHVRRERDGHGLRARSSGSSPTSCAACWTSTSSASSTASGRRCRTYVRRAGPSSHVSSALAYRGIPLQAAYCSSKAACRDVPRVGASRAAEGRRRRRRLARPSGRDQHAAVRPRPPEDRLPAAAGAADLRAGAVRRRRAALLRAPDSRAPARLGRAEAALGPEARAARGRLGSAPDRLEGQHTDEPKPIDSPDNLFETLPGDPGAHGRFDDQARSRRCGRRCGQAGSSAAAASAGAGC